MRCYANAQPAAYIIPISYLCQSKHQRRKTDVSGLYLRMLLLEMPMRPADQGEYNQQGQERGKRGRIIEEGYMDEGGDY